MTKPPCDPKCPRRCVGCHGKEHGVWRCKEWGEYMEDKEVRVAAADAEKREKLVVSDYLRDKHTARIHRERIWR